MLPTLRWEKKLHKIFEFNKFAYLCLPQKLSDNVCFVKFFVDKKSSVARKICWHRHEFKKCHFSSAGRATDL